MHATLALLSVGWYLNLVTIFFSLQPHPMFTVPQSSSWLFCMSPWVERADKATLLIFRRQGNKWIKYAGSHLGHDRTYIYLCFWVSIFWSVPYFCPAQDIYPFPCKASIKRNRKTKMDSSFFLMKITCIWSKVELYKTVQDKSEFYSLPDP